MIWRVAGKFGQGGASLPWRLVVGALLACAHALAAAPRVFDVPSQPLAKALQVFAIQADASIGYAGIDLSGKRSAPLRDSATPTDALVRILAGSGLTFETVGPDAFRIETLADPPPPSAAPALSPVERPRIEEITVTAAKRPENLQSSAVSIAALGGDELRGIGIATAHEATHLFAGLTATNQGPGRNKFFVRGLSDGAFNGQTQSVVGIYLDDTRLTFNASDPNLQLIDIDRLEVLRGPMGTLYGAGSIGGLVRIVTRRPQFDSVETSASFDLATTAHGGPSGGLAGVINVPYSDGRGAFRAVGFIRHDGGFIDDRTMGTNNVNRTRASGGRAAMAYRLGDAWTVDLDYAGQSIFARDTQYFDRGLGPYVRANRVAEPHDNDFSRFAISATGDLGWSEVVTSTAWISHRVTSRFDASAASPALTGGQAATAAFDEANRYRTAIHETRLTSPSAQEVKWLAGFFAAHVDQTVDAALARIEGGRAVYQTHRRDDVAEVAGFGEVTIPAAHMVEVTAGFRLDRGVINADSISDGSAGFGAPEAFGRRAQYSFAPKVIIAYRPHFDRLFYVEAAKGYRLGGINIDSPLTEPQRIGDRDGRTRTVSSFKPDSLWNYEAGAKTSWFDGALVANGAAFFQEWDNIQSDQYRPTGFKLTTNVGNVRNFGFELEASAEPIHGLSLSANVTLNRPDFSPFPGGRLTEADRLPVVPRFSSGARAKYDFDVLKDLAGSVYVGLTQIGHSRLTFDAASAPLMGGYLISTAGLSFQHGPCVATMRVDNIGNSRANTFAFGNPFSFATVAQVTPPRPRTVTVSISWTH